MNQIDPLVLDFFKLSLSFIVRLFQEKNIDQGCLVQLVLRSLKIRHD